LKRDYWIERKNVVILGHNSKCKHIMAGFVAFSNEWKRNDEEIVRIVVIDDKANLEKMNYYRDFPFFSFSTNRIFLRKKYCIVLFFLIFFCWIQLLHKNFTKDSKIFCQYLSLNIGRSIILPPKSPLLPRGPFVFYSLSHFPSFLIR
jgi:hypothetical protein